MKIKAIIVLIIILIMAVMIFYAKLAKNDVNTAINVYCAGDSITAASYPEHLEKLLKSINKNVHVINKGVPGHNSSQYLKYMRETNFPNKNEQINFVLLQLGTNDVRIDTDHLSTDSFIKNMKEIIHKFKNHKNKDMSSPKVFLSTIPPVVVKIPHFFDETSRERVEKEINPAIIKIGQEEGCPVIDNHKLFIEVPSLLPEIHPNEDGYKAMAENWFKMLKPYIIKSHK
jgi:lysophospholipase L1-like esterase